MVEQTIAKYIRLSLDDAKTDSLSIENQRLLLDEYILNSDMDGEVLEFVDDGYSGTNFERPAVQELLELVRQGRVNCILVKDFSRFGRSIIETGYFIEQVFPLYRVRFIAVSDSFDSFELHGDTGGMEVAFKFLINEYYSRDLSMKIHSAKREKALRGEFVTKNGTFGYMLDENRSMVIDPEAAETVRLIFEMYAGKKSLACIAKRLYDEKRPVPSAWKKHRQAALKTDELRYIWETSAICSILRNERYVGTYVAGKTKTVEVGNHTRARIASEDWIRIPDHHPAIISQELFETVQRQLLVKREPLRKREFGTSQRYAPATSVLAGKVICGHCGHAMRLSNTKNAAFHCWFTHFAADAACYRLRILQSELEETVRESVTRQAATVLDAGESAVNALQSPAVPEQEDRLEKLRDEKRRLYETFVLGGIDQDGYRTRKSAVDDELERALRVYETILNENMKSRPDAASIQAARSALDSNTLTRELVDMLIDKILVYPDNRIEIGWKISGFANCLPPQTVLDVAV